jgi:hypothetical protein
MRASAYQAKVVEALELGDKILVIDGSFLLEPAASTHGAFAPFPLIGRQIKAMVDRGQLVPSEDGKELVIAKASESERCNGTSAVVSVDE